MFLDSWINYLKLSNSSRITGLSTHDPFAIAGFIMLVILIPVALVLLLVTARQSANSVWDGLEFDRQIQDRERERRRRSRQANEADIARQESMEARQSQWSNMATTGKRNVSFADGFDEIPATPRTPKPLKITNTRKLSKIPQAPRTPSTPLTPYAPRTPSKLRDSWCSDHLLLLPPSPNHQHEPLKISLSLEDIAKGDSVYGYEHGQATERPPQIEVFPEEPAARIRWTVEMQESLRRVSVVEMV